MKNFIKIIIIVAILILLVFLSVGIVRLVPKAVSSLASATVSLGSFFSGNRNDSTENSNNNATTTGSGFVIVGSTSTPSTTGSNSYNSTSTETRSLVNILRPGTNSNSSNTNNESNRNTSTNTTRYSNSYNQYTNNACISGGTPNIAVRILSRGTINPVNGQYIETNAFTPSDVVSVRFIVENRGTCPTNTWNLRVEMPSQNPNDQVRNIVNASSLPAGSSVTGQANFDMPRIGTNNITLTVSDNSGRDSIASDNFTSSPITVIGSNTGGGITGDGRPDLAVRILRMGTIGFNNQFVPNSFNSINGNYRLGEKIAIQFEVINQGQTASGMWSFRIDSVGIPNGTLNNNQFEQSIAPGAKIVYTIGFDAMNIGINNLTVYVDHLNQVNEFNESNNTAVAAYTVSY